MYILFVQLKFKLNPSELYFRKRYALFSIKRLKIQNEPIITTSYFEALPIASARLSKNPCSNSKSVHCVSISFNIKRANRAKEAKPPARQLRLFKKSINTSTVDVRILRAEIYESAGPRSFGSFAFISLFIRESSRSSN